MVEYIDSSLSNKTQYIRTWLENNIKKDIKAFRMQTGYFSYSSLIPFARILKHIAKSQGAIRLVIGANKGDLSLPDLNDIFHLVKNKQNCSLTVVAFSNELFHPKCYHIIRNDGSQTAIVGSGNMTPAGISFNVEAAIILDTNKGDDPKVLETIAKAIDKWSSDGEAIGAFQITDNKEIIKLSRQGIINIPRPELELLKAAPSKKTTEKITLKSRKRLWKQDHKKSNRKTAEPIHKKVSFKAKNVVKRWSKKLLLTDAMKNAGHPIGELRLTRAKLNIDQNIYFRFDLFASANWISKIMQSQGKSTKKTIPRQSEEAIISFLVDIPTFKSPKIYNLIVKYAPHRAFGQKNYVTSIKWGQLAHELKAAPGKGFTNQWVIVEKYDTGEFGLTIKRKAPSEKLIL